MRRLVTVESAKNKTQQGRAGSYVMKTSSLHIRASVGLVLVDNFMNNRLRKSAQALALMLVFQQAHAIDIHGIHIGDKWDSARLEQALAYPTVLETRRVKCADADETCTGTTRYLSTDVRLTIEGKSGRVIKVTMTLATADFESVVTSLKAAFGQPIEDWSCPPAAPVASLFCRRVDWRLANEELFALKFSTMAIVRLSTPAESLAKQYPPPA